jgi:hypothetical protein
MHKESSVDAAVVTEAMDLAIAFGFMRKNKYAS